MLLLLDRMAPFGQTLTHRKQPLHFSARSRRACLWKGRFTFPNTCRGQAATQAQQALQWRVSRRIKLVSGEWLFFMGAILAKAGYSQRGVPAW
ncbi:MAG TPA: hypothetical protein VMT91_11795 [Anaerolineales bacterium]|nr:hypothetical protein [Anaerolineales bacterium]